MTIRILLADDHQITRHGLKSLLDQQKKTSELVIALVTVVILVIVTIVFVVPLLNQ